MENKDVLNIEESMTLKDKNEKYLKILLNSMTATTEDFERMKDQLQLAPTPKEVVHQETGVKLYRYTPVKEELHPIPLLIIPSLILKYYVMDLIKEHSLIEHLVNQGIDVYLLDWGVPGPEHGQLTFDYYIDTFMRRAVRKVSRLTGQEKINLMGQCLGGTLAAIFAALYPEKINRFIALTTPVDFEDAGLLSIWTDKKIFDLDKVVNSFGATISPEFIHSCFQYLDLTATVQKYKNLYNNILDENFLYYYRAVDCWVNDKIPFPSKVFRKFIGELYQENLLIKGEFTINNRKVDLSRMDFPILNLVAQFDHVFPEKAAKNLNDLVSGPVEYHLIPAGHVTLIVLFPVRTEVFSIITDFILERPHKTPEEEIPPEDEVFEEMPPEDMDLPDEGDQEPEAEIETGIEIESEDDEVL